jgi:drug/metabolite transporter (DMT)-like permease
MNFLTAVWMISLIPLLLIPFNIALFYQRTFKRWTYPGIFFVSLFLYIAGTFAQYSYPSYSVGNWLFALGGILLGGASIRLYQVMIKRWQ